MSTSGSTSLRPLRALGNAYYEVLGRFKPDGANPPTVTAGKGFTVAHTATGWFTVTLDVPVKGAVTAWAHRHTVRGTVVLDSVKASVPAVNATTGICTLEIGNWNEQAGVDTLADVTAAAGEEVSFGITVYATNAE